MVPVPWAQAQGQEDAEWEAGWAWAGDRVEAAKADSGWVSAETAFVQNAAKPCRIESVFRVQS